MAFPARLGCSTISFQHLTLPEALDDIQSLGFGEIDLGALPGVCDHVPFDLTDSAIEQIAADIAASGIRVVSVNGDIGDLNIAPDDAAARATHRDRLLRLTAAIGADALVLPCGSIGHEPAAGLDADLGRIAGELADAAEAAEAAGTAVWVEAQHFLRLCWNAERATALLAQTPASVGAVLDLAHVVAAGDRIPDVVEAWGERTVHVHLRDAVLGDFSRPIGSADVDFDEAFRALAASGYRGGFALELPARAYTDDATTQAAPEYRAERKDAIRAAGDHIAALLPAAGITNDPIEGAR